MKKIIALIAVVMLLTIGFGNMASAKKNSTDKGSQSQTGPSAGNGHGHGPADGPAPNSHDGVSDGSGFADKGGTRDDRGAPNSGDGVPDGSGK